MAYIITGVAGFIGSNLASSLMASGHKVVGVDNLCRPGSHMNLARLQNPAFEFHCGDVANEHFINTVFVSVPEVKAIFHLAGQVAVTTSITNPRNDFNTNALGTFNVLEATRMYHQQTPFIYSSTNKVYGKMENMRIVDNAGRYAYANLPRGVNEEYPLDFHSPYGCSKGAGDQYVVDYARIYGLKTVCLRQSCIYGPNQLGVEDQGWVAWFTIAAIMNRPITIYGDGGQVRDVLFVDDLLNAYMKAADNAEILAGQCFNIGGGPDNTLSLLELVHMLEARTGGKMTVAYQNWRAGDQMVFVCNIDKASRLLNWTPKTSIKDGFDRLYRWCENNTSLFAI